MNQVTEDSKRLFFGFEISAPWPNDLPRGRILLEGDRHLTVAFLGNVSFGELEKKLPNMPRPTFRVGLVGNFDRIIFLPKVHPHVAAYTMSWFHDFHSLLDYVDNLVLWLKEIGFSFRQEHEFLPHVTICRAPFDYAQWRKAFQKIPCTLTNFHLFESLGHLRYKSLWSLPISPPFIELEHTADIAFKILGETSEQIFWNAYTALLWKCPELLKYKHRVTPHETVEEIVIELNQWIAYLDCDSGSPLKAVSFHGDIEKTDSGFLTWEMIVDV